MTIMSSILCWFCIFCHDPHLLENIFAKRYAPSTKITIFSRPQKLITILALLPELAKDCAINDDRVKHPSSLSCPLPQTLFAGLCIYQAVVPKLRSFPPAVTEIYPDLGTSARRLPEAIECSKQRLGQVYFVTAVLSVAIHICRRMH